VLFEHLQRLALAGGVVAGGEDQRCVALSGGGVADAREDVGVVGVGDVRRQDENDAAFALAEVARQQVGLVGEFLNGRIDAFSRVRTDRALLVEQTRNRGD
jgi:hypothetical protein